MSLGVSKDCFPAPTECHNCKRKKTESVKKEKNPKKEYKRCSNCHLFTYCDKDCQREHWIKVHRDHCRILSGKTPVENFKHEASTCTQCIEKKMDTNPTQIYSETSPKSRCNIELVITSLKQELSNSFGFHGEGNNCNCSEKFGLELPFPLGEVSGQYMEIGNTGLDAMLAHVLKIISAMGIKAINNEERRIALGELWSSIIDERVRLWFDVLVSGKPRIQFSTHLSELVDNLKNSYEATNPWWQILRFSVSFVLNTHVYNGSNFYDSRKMDDPRFRKLKLMVDYHQSLLQNQAIVCEKKMWASFMLWPQLVNGSLAILLPSGTHCENCNAELRGKLTLALDSNYKSLPWLLSEVSDNGALVAGCPFAKSPDCWRDYHNKNVGGLIRQDEDQWKEYLKEETLFSVESRDCDFCLKMSPSSHRCSACLTVQYCSTVCQKKDLGFHNTVCSAWAKDKSRRILGKEKQKDHWKKVIEQN